MFRVLSNQFRPGMLSCLLGSLIFIILGCGTSREKIHPPPPAGNKGDLSLATPPFNPYGNRYVIHPGDLLEISVLGENDLSKSVRIGEDGRFSYPLLGKIKGAGMTSDKLEASLIFLLKDYLVKPQVSVFIKEYARISILGEVKRPGSYEIKGRLTVTQAIALAGGFTKLAYRNGIKVIREKDGKTLVIPVKFRNIVDDGDKSLDIILQPNDLITVPESFF